MKRYYKDRKELFDATKEMEIEEGVEEGIQDKEEFGLMEEISGEEGNALTKNRGNPKCKTLKKLNQIMLNEAFMEKFPASHGIFLPYLISDHSPAVLKLPNGIMKRRKAFRFLNFVTDKKEFLLNVNESWKIEINGHMMYKVVKTMKLMKPMLNSLSRKNGNIFERVAKLKDCLKECQVEVDRYPHDENIKTKSCKVLNEYYKAMNDENSLLMQKEKVEWLKDGDRNTKFFHKIIKVTSFPTDKIMFPNKLSSDEAQRMCSGVSEVEIKNAMFDIEDSKALGPNGFTGRFYKSAWSIIGKDMYKDIQEFFVTGKILGEVNATLISLVPKLKIPNKVSDFRPIACFNVLYKCISKIVTNRIKRVLGKVAFKIDLQKAYDTIDWSFLKVILEHFGFRGKMVDWIMVCVSTTKFSININGERKGYFNGGRGLRQGYPIIIMGRNIGKTKEFKYHHGCRKLQITHLCFVDDLLVFCHRDIKSVSTIKEALEEFSSYSGLRANMNKSTMFFGGMTIAEQNVILDIIPFANRRLPIRYLGVPLITKKINATDCKPLIDKVKSRVTDWKNKALSYSGRLQLINSILIIENGNWPEGWENEYPILKSYKFPRLREGKKDEVFWVDNSRQERLIGVNHVWKDLCCVGPRVVLA
nr:hypothetical protein [Tanacetum cinerariifolium]